MGRSSGGRCGSAKPASNIPSWRSKQTDKQANMQKLVVYTCQFGGYGPLPNPFPDGASGFDRVCFTDDPSLTSDGWDVIVLEKSGLGPQVDSRLPKLLPHRYLKDFDLSVYCDSRVHFKVDPIAFARMEALKTSSLKCFSHPWRGCVYDEAEVVIEQGIYDERSVRAQMDAYRRQGYPEQNGLMTATVLLRRHNEPELVDLSELWHWHFLKFCQRDQLSFNFVAWLKGFEYEQFKGSIVDNDYLRWVTRSEIDIVPNNFNEERFKWLVPEAASSGKSARRYFLENWDPKKRAAKKKRPDLPYFSKLTQLANKYKSDKGTLYYNGHGYARAYEQYLEPLRNREFSLLEIGVAPPHPDADRSPGDVAAGNLRMWRDYFKKANIVGLDMTGATGVAPADGMVVLGGNPRDAQCLDKALAAASGGYRMIVDSTGEMPGVRLTALAHLLPGVPPGGYYFAENLHIRPPSRSVKKGGEFLHVLKGLADGYAVESPYISAETLEMLSRRIEFIHFYDSLDRSFGKIHRDALAVIKMRDSFASSTVKSLRRVRRFVKRRR